MNGSNRARLSIAADKATCRPLGRYRSNALDLVVLEEGFDVLHDTVAGTASDPHGDAQFPYDGFSYILLFGVILHDAIALRKEVSAAAQRHGRKAGNGNFC